MDKDLGQDMQDSSWFKTKIRSSEYYAQNVYAALCNMRWQPKDIWPVLADQYWSCSWRSAGGIVASLRGHGEDYMNYYCSGIENFDEDGLDPEFVPGKKVSEGTVTDEVRKDLEDLGWHPVPYDKK